jgi:hypothetical protein
MNFIAEKAMVKGTLVAFDEENRKLVVLTDQKSILFHIEKSHLVANIDSDLDEGAVYIFDSESRRDQIIDQKREYVRSLNKVMREMPAGEAKKEVIERRNRVAVDIYNHKRDISHTEKLNG